LRFYFELLKDLKALKSPKIAESAKSAISRNRKLSCRKTGPLAVKAARITGFPGGTRQAELPGLGGDDTGRATSTSAALDLLCKIKERTSARRKLNRKQGGNLATEQVRRRN
jgi:hypothetical protein